MNTPKILLASLLATVVSTSSALTVGEYSPQASSSVLRAVLPIMSIPTSAVKNLPYSGEIEMEQQQNMSDGNQIATSRRAKSYRDSAGRSRQELLDSEGNPSAIILREVNGPTYYLNPKDKTGVIYLPASARASATDSKDLYSKRVERVQVDGTKTIVNVRVRVPDGAGNNTSSAVSPAIVNAINDAKWQAEMTTKSLPAKDIDGIKASGTLSSYEIPAGAIGNRNPIVVTDETWRSFELRVTLYSKRNDPRTGERMWRLTNIRRDEPAAALFSVPTDYTITEMTATSIK